MHNLSPVVFVIPRLTLGDSPNPVSSLVLTSRICIEANGFTKVSSMFRSFDSVDTWLILIRWVSTGDVYSSESHNISVVSIFFLEDDICLARGGHYATGHPSLRPQSSF